MAFCLKRGFSLIEMMVVVGIMGIMLVTGVASYNRLNDRAKVEQAAQLLATELRVIQKKADAGMHSCDSGESFRGMRVERIDSTNIRYCEQCGASFSGCITILTNVPIGTFEPFVFLSVGRGASEERSIALPNDIYTRFTVVISRSGAISVEE